MLRYILAAALLLCSTAVHAASANVYTVKVTITTNSDPEGTDDVTCPGTGVLYLDVKGSLGGGSLSLRKQNTVDDIFYPVEDGTFVTTPIDRGYICDGAVSKQLFDVFVTGATSPDLDVVLHVKIN